MEKVNLKAKGCQERGLKESKRSVWYMCKGRESNYRSSPSVYVFADKTPRCRVFALPPAPRVHTVYVR